MRPGEMMVVNNKEAVSYQLLEPKQQQFCMFQLVYMCRPESQFNTLSGITTVYKIRETLGAELAEYYRPDVDFVSPIPDSGVPAACGYSNATGLPNQMSIIRNRYLSRTFMQSDQSKREAAVDLKLNPIPEVLKGKRVILIDDSLVRGTTMNKIVAKTRNAGAIEVHVAFTCPPVISGCMYGIDIYNENLAARQFRDRTHDEMNIEIAEIIGADSVYYLTIDSLVKALNMSREGLCLSCLNGIYVQPGKLVSEEERKK
jgi:amidophosphoribosyltransferase